MNIEISSRNQAVSISLTPRLYLFKEGSGTTYNIVRYVQEAATFNADTNSIRLAGTTWGNSNQRFYFNKKINLTNFTKLYVDYIYSSQSASNATARIGPSSNVPTSYGTNETAIGYVATLGLYQTSSRRADSLNISSCNNSYYISYLGGSTITFYNIWLE